MVGDPCQGVPYPRRLQVGVTTSVAWMTADVACACVRCCRDYNIGKIYAKSKDFVDYVRKSLRKLELALPKVCIYYSWGAVHVVCVHVVCVSMCLVCCLFVFVL